LKEEDGMRLNKWDDAGWPERVMVLTATAVFWASAAWLVWQVVQALPFMQTGG
jgi:hypothetical protein